MHTAARGCEQPLRAGGVEGAAVAPLRDVARHLLGGHRRRQALRHSRGPPGWRRASFARASGGGGGVSPALA
jgi:hypothetical protein